MVGLVQGYVCSCCQDPRVASPPSLSTWALEGHACLNLGCARCGGACRGAYLPAACALPRPA